MGRVIYEVEMPSILWRNPKRRCWQLTIWASLKIAIKQRQLKGHTLPSRHQRLQGNIESNSEHPQLVDEFHMIGHLKFKPRNFSPFHPFALPQEKWLHIHKAKYLSDIGSENSSPEWLSLQFHWCCSFYPDLHGQAQQRQICRGLGKIYEKQRNQPCLFIQKITNEGTH